MATSGPFLPRQILRRLFDAGVKFLVIGGIAAQYHGASLQTFDLDICCARDQANLDVLANVLRGMGARLRGAPERLPFRLDAETLRNGDSFTFATDLGDFDILGTPAGGFDYDTLIRSAVEFEVGGATVMIASLDDLIAMKRAAGRLKDRLAMEHLGALREELDRRG